MLIGAVTGTGVWILASILFRVYVSNFGSYSAMSGVLGGVIILLLWLYITGSGSSSGVRWRPRFRAATGTRPRAPRFRSP